MPKIDPKILEQYVVTANSGKYNSWAEVNAKFPELSAYDSKLLEQYVVTANSGKYNSWAEVNAKFPEFNEEIVKKNETAQQAGASGATPSPLRSSGNLQEMLAAAPPLPADARVNVPIGAQPQRPQERAITATPARTALQFSPKEIRANQSEIESKLNELSVDKLNTATASLNEKATLLESLASKANAGDKNAANEYNKLYSSYEKESAALTPKIDEYNALMQQYEELGKQPPLGIVVGDELEEERRSVYKREGLNIFSDAVERGLLGGEQANLLNAFENMEDVDLERLAEIQQERERFAGSDMYQALGQLDILDLFEVAPMTVIAEVVGESLVAMVRHGYARAIAGAAMGAAAGSVVPGVGTIAGGVTGLSAGMGISSLNLEYSSKFIETLAEAGVDVKSADSLKAAFQDDKLLAKARNIALRKGIPIAVFDLISGNLGGRFAAKPGATLVKKIIGGAKETGVQATLGGAGEAAGQLIAGEELNATSIFLEMIAEPFTSIPEIAANVLVRNSKANKPTPADVVARVVADPSVDLANMSEMLDISVGIGEITVEQKNGIMAELEAMSNAVGKVPDAMAAAAPQLAPIILEKQNIDARIAELNVEMATKDESFAPLYKMEIRDLEARKAQLNEQIQAAIAPKAQQQVTGIGEVEVFSQTDNKGRTIKYFSNTTEKDGVTKTTFTFNRSDKDSSQRNNALSGVPVETALGDKYTIDETYLPEGARIIGVSEIRATDKGAAATVMFEADGQRFQGEVKLVEQSLKETPQAGAVVEGVQEGGVDTRIANSPLAEVVNKRGVITDANGNLVEGDVYVDGERVVLEAGGRIYDTLGSIDELSQMTAEQLPVQVVAPRITATEGGFTYNSDAGVMPQGTRITPQGTGLKAVKRDKNGNVKSVVVKDDAGNTFNLKGEDAQAMAFELMMDEISKGNLDAKIVLNDEAATAINTAGRPATTQAADSGATQADATRQGAATPTTATERGDGGRGSRVEATQETEASIEKRRQEELDQNKSTITKSVTIFKGVDLNGEPTVAEVREMEDGSLQVRLLDKEGKRLGVINTYPKGVSVENAVDGVIDIAEGFEKSEQTLEEARLTGKKDKINAKYDAELAALKAKPDAAKEPSTEGVDARKQAEDGEGVGKEDSKRKEAAQEGEVADKPRTTSQERLKAARDKRKAAADKLSQIWNDAKNTGIASNIIPDSRKEAEARLDKALKENKELLQAVKDVIRSNIEIGTLTLRENLADIAKILGIDKIGAADRRAVESVFNKEVLSALKNKQSADFERQDVRAALGEYIQENKKILGESANGQALKLVNEAETEAGYERAYEYIEKLINDQEFREAVGNASKAIKGSRKKLSESGVGRAAIDFFAKLKTTAISDLGLMQRLAEILSAPRDGDMNRIQQLMTDVQKHLDESAQNATIPTLESVEKKISGLLTGRKRDDAGEMQSIAKEFDTPSKIRGLARSIANAEAQIFSIKGLTEDQEAQLLEMLEEAKGALNDAKSTFAEAIAAFNEQNKQEAKDIIERINNGDIEIDPDVAEATGILALGKNLDAIDGIDFYDSQRLVDGLQDISNGFKPLGFYRAVSSNIINAPQKNAIKVAAENVDDNVQAKISSTQKYGGVSGYVKMLIDYVRYGKEFVSAGKGLAKEGSFTSSKDFLADMLTRGLANLDKLAYVDMWESRPLATYIVKPLNDAMENWANDKANTIKAYLKDSSRKDSSFKSAGGLISRNKVGFYLAQLSENNARNKFNMLAQTADYYRANGFSKDGMDEQRNAVIMLANKYPNGIVESDLTAAEKQMAKAFKAQFDNNLQQKQAKAALTAGDSFDPLIEYYPYIASADISQFMTEDVDNVKAESAQLYRGASNQTKSPKIKSDRNLQRSESADFFPIIGDIDVVMDIASSQVLKQYHLQPTLFNAMRAMNSMEKWAAKNARGSVDFVKALQEAYKAHVNSKMSGFTGKAYKAIAGTQSVYVANRLQEITRVTGEVVTGGIALWGLLDSPSNIKIPSLSINRKINERYGASILQSKPVNMDKNTWDRMKDYYKTLISPDAVNTQFWAEVFFPTTLAQQYEKVSGEKLDYKRLKDDAYVESIDKNLAKAYDGAIVRMADVYSGLTIGKPVAVRTILGGAYLRKDASQTERMLNQMTMLFGNYAAEVGSDYSLTLQSGYGKGRNAESVSVMRKLRKTAAIIGQGMMYNLVIDLTRTGAEAFFEDDEEEKQRIWDIYKAGFTDYQKISAAGIGSILYFALGPYGSVGKVISYSTMVALSKLYQEWKEADIFTSKAEADLSIKSIDDMSRDIFYRGIPRDEKAYMSNALEIGAGGFGFMVKESIDGLQLAREMASGNANTFSALYGLGLVFNASVGRKYGIPFPFVQTFERASRKVKEKGFESSDPDKIAKNAKTNIYKKNQLVDNYALQTYIQEVKENNPKALKENKAALKAALKEKGFSNDLIKKDLDRMEDKYNQSKLPLYLYKIVKQDVPKAAALMAARDFVVLKNKMEEAMKSGNGEEIKRSEESIAVFRKTIREEKMSNIDNQGDNRKEFRKEFYKELKNRGIEY